MILSRSGIELNEIWAKQANLVEADADLRMKKRRAQKSLGDLGSQRVYASALRRSGDAEAGDLHELHAVGRARAGAHDHESNAMKKAHSSNTSRTREDQRIYRDSNKNHNRLSEEWHALAKRVHAAGGNPSLAYYKPSQQSHKEHWEQLAQHAANRNQVSFDRSAGDHRFSAVAGKPAERRERLNRVTREVHAAAEAHNPDSKPRIGALTHGYGRAIQRVYFDAQS